MVEVYYGSFGHWGHPFIVYQEGLKKLFDQVQKAKTVTDWYVKALANCWLPCSVVQSFGDVWDEHPLLHCLEVPKALDPSELF